MDPMEKNAKLGVLKEIKDMASKKMGEDVAGLKKVTVAAPDEKSLEEGLDKAKDLVGEVGDHAAAEKPEAPKAEADELGDLSAEEIDQLIEALKAKRAMC
jgi:rRNA maturation endonuclease Nob1